MGDIQERVRAVTKPRRPHMSIMTEEPACTTAIRPFTIEISGAASKALHASIVAMRWLDKEIVAAADAPQPGEYRAQAEGVAGLIGT